MEASRAGCSRRSRSPARSRHRSSCSSTSRRRGSIPPKLEVQEFIREIRDSHDSTILLCTHDLGEAKILANRVGILDRGRLLALESADAIKQRYEAETLEEAFFAATGREFEAEDDEDDDREVFA